MCFNAGQDVNGQCDTVRTLARLKQHTFQHVRLLHDPNSTVPLVTYQILFLRHAWPDSTAFPAMEELAIHTIMRSGISQLNPIQFSARLESFGATLKVVQEADYIGLQLKCLKTNFPSALDLLLELIKAPRWDAIEYLKVQQELSGLAEIRMGTYNYVLKNNYDNLFFYKHPYQHIESNNLYVLKEKPLERIKAFYADKMLKYEKAITVQGAIDPDLCLKVTHERLGFKNQKPFPILLPKISPPEVRVTFESVQLPSNYLLGFFSGPGIDKPDGMAVQLALWMLQQRLEMELCRKRDLSCALQTEYRYGRLSYGYVEIEVPVANLTVRKVAEIHRETGIMGFTDQELAEAKMALSIQYYADAQSVTSKSRLMAQAIALNQHTAWINFPQQLKNISVETVNQAYNKYIGAMYWLYVGNTDKIERSVFTHH
jgi:zinc protease